MIPVEEVAESSMPDARKPINQRPVTREDFLRGILEQIRREMSKWR